MIKTLDIELAVFSHFNSSGRVIVPNVSWGMFRYECDVVVMTNSGYLWEIEIKVNRADLIKDKDKRHNHDDPQFSRLYFAIPERLRMDIEHIPERAGIIIVDERINDPRYFECCVREIRKARDDKTHKCSDCDRYKLARLGAIRLWTLKRQIKRIKK